MFGRSGVSKRKCECDLSRGQKIDLPLGIFNGHTTINDKYLDTLISNVKIKRK